MDLPFWKDLIAGSVSGGAVVLSGHPFDTVKVRLQTQTMALDTGQFSHSFRGGIDCAIQTARKEGVYAFFKGMGSPLAVTPITHAVTWASYEQAKRFFERRSRIHNPSSNSDNKRVSLTRGQLVAAGSWSGFVTTFVIVPIELVKNRLQVQYGKAGVCNKYRGPTDVVKQTMASQGIRGLYRGLVPGFIVMIPCFIARFYSYEWVIEKLTPEGGSKDDLGPISLLFSGGVAGVCCWAACYPQDLVKSRIQVQADNKPRQYTPRYYDGGFIDCWKQIVRKEGYYGLWRGFGTCATRAFPANAAGFLAYEWAVKYLNKD